MDNLELLMSLGVVNQNSEEVEETTGDSQDVEQDTGDSEEVEETTGDSQDVEQDTGDSQEVEETTDNNEEVEQDTGDNEEDNAELSMFAALGMAPKKKKAEPKTNKKVAPESTKVKVESLEKDKVKIVKAYGQEVMTIQKGEKADLEEIRQYLVDTLGYREFQKSETEMIIINDGDTQYIIPQPKFKAKG